MRSDEGRRFTWMNHERRVFVLSLAAGLPAVVLALVLLIRDDYSTKVTWTWGTLVVGCWLNVSLVVRAADNSGLAGSSADALTPDPK